MSRVANQTGKLRILAETKDRYDDTIYTIDGGNGFTYKIYYDEQQDKVTDIYLDTVAESSSSAPSEEFKTLISDFVRRHRLRNIRLGELKNVA